MVWTRSRASCQSSLGRIWPDSSRFHQNLLGRLARPLEGQIVGGQGAGFRGVSLLAEELFRQPDRLTAARIRGMEKDFGWARSVEEYLTVYRKVLDR